MAEPPQPVTGVILDEETIYTLSELRQASGLGGDQLVTMVEVGILEPLPERRRWCFTGESVSRLQAALRLQRDLGVNLEGAALALDLLDELHHLRRRSALLERQLAD
ncbi:chaperone modulator CbpM [Thiohalorhabdus sp.]|uniref:chaperone modulator CbpM n=1 Tax=Thiohalorhabdus sp. TaxID=3094134 RepID=UPI002FC37BAA